MKPGDIVVPRPGVAICAEPGRYMENRYEVYETIPGILLEERRLSWHGDTYTEMWIKVAFPHRTGWLREEWVRTA